MNIKWMLCFVVLATSLGITNPSEASDPALQGPTSQITLEVPGWRDVSNTNAPVGRFWHTAIWTGSEMIVFGGIGSYQFYYLNNGGRYNPATDSWLPISLEGAPSGRMLHTAIWTGSEMIIWGGFGDGGSTANGARYNPATDQWAPIATQGAPSARYNHTAVWTGTEMIIWGGTYLNDEVLNDGARYNPSTEQWTPLPLDGAPSARLGQAAVWTGSEMIIWGGEGTGHISDGACYNLAANRWTPLPADGAPQVWVQPNAVWTGTKMIAWGGIAGSAASYDPLTNSWTPLAAGNSIERVDYTAVWAGENVLIWGGWDGHNLHNDGLRYHPATDSMAALPLEGAPSARDQHTAVWTGSEMIVWGGLDSNTYLGDGARLREYYATYFPWVSR